MGSERGVVDFERRPSNEQRRVENGGAEDDEDGAGDDADKTEAKAPQKRNISLIQRMTLAAVAGSIPREDVSPFPSSISRYRALCTHAYYVLVASNDNFIGGIFT